MIFFLSFRLLAFVVKSNAEKEMRAECTSIELNDVQNDREGSEISENNSGIIFIYSFIYYSFSWIQPRQYVVSEVLF